MLGEFFRGSATGSPVLGEFFAEVPLEAPCWASFFAGEPLKALTVSVRMRVGSLVWSGFVDRVF